MESFIRTEKQRKLLAKIEELIPVFQKREPQLDAPGSFPFDNIEDLKKINYTKLTLPTEFGGQGLGLYEYILAQETIAVGCGSTALSIGWTNGTILEYVESHHWNSEAAKVVLKAIANGGLINTASSENNAGSPTRGAIPTTSVVRDGDDLVITGEKIFTTAAPALTHFIITATNEKKEIEMILVPSNTKGVSLKDTWDSLAMRGTASQTVILDHVRVPDTYVLQTRSPQLNAAKGWLLHIPACYIGIAKAARNYALNFATSYIPSSLGKPIAEAPNIKQLIGEMELTLTTARHMLYGTVERYEHCEDKTAFKEPLDVTKIEVTNAAMKVVDLAMQIVGARALSESNPMHRYFLNVRAGLYNPPMSDVIQTKFANEAIAKFMEK
ncbi:acyl-CoA dehydrogenase family protein [Rummeliibacillus sp. NPDC094406]|uniref:acyl-CoA dehydrogenase family protein n=1 Tax=Rummeliibacillus sp. NPDC094406 TaxID=3364511 RepID=UPI00381F3170